MSGFSEEGLTLLHDEGTLRLVDVQDVPHIIFVTGNGDPCVWSRNLVQTTCKALGVTQAASDGEFVVIGKAIRLWHLALGAEDGFLP